MKLFIILSLVLSTQAFAKNKPLTRPMIFTGVESLETADADFEGIAKLSGCSAALVKFKGQPATSKAMILTNDHCLDDQATGRYTANSSYTKSFQIFDKNKKLIPKTFVSTKMIYATQTDTDFGLLEIADTYADIETKYDVTPLEISETVTSVGSEVMVITGYFGKRIDCTIDAFIYKIVEDAWTWKNSYRYTNCQTGHGTSGSPIILKGTREVVGINNTGNDDGAKCTMNNPCEVDAAGVITVRKGAHYGQQINDLYSCLTKDFKIDVKTPGCKLLGGDSWIK